MRIGMKSKKQVNLIVKTLLEAYLRQDNVKIELNNEFNRLSFKIKEDGEIVEEAKYLDDELRTLFSDKYLPF